MASISTIQGTAGSRLAAGQVAETTRPAAADAAPSPQKVPGAAPGNDKQQAPDLDPEAVRKMVDDLQDAIDRASADPHRVEFQQDSRTKGFVIEIRNLDGSLVRQFPPEKVLNLQEKMDELSGMVIDEMT